MAPAFILFDLVGTLLDERSDHEALDRTMAHVVRRFSLKAKPKELSGRFALALMEIIGAEPHVAEESDFLSFRDAAPDIFAGVLQHEGMHVTDADKTWFWDIYLKVQRDVWRPYREVPKVLETLAALGHRMGVVTDADRYMLDDIVPTLRMDRFLSVGVAAEEAGHVKPHPAMFRLALERAGVTPDDAIFVGDSYERDLLGAAAAGIRKGVLVDRHRARTVDVPTVSDLKALPELLARPL